jgi:uncharacterized membrane protein
MESIIKKVGGWLFLIGICVALLVGLIFGIGQTMNVNLTNLETPLGIIVVVLGFIVSTISFFALGAVTQEKVPMFLIASLILIGLAIAVTSTKWIFGGFRELAPLFINITQYLVIFVAPASVILVIRSLWDATRTKETVK